MKDTTGSRGLILAGVAGVAALAGFLLPSPARADDPPRYKSAKVDTAHGDREFLFLWPEGAPGALGSEAVDRPKITPYPAPAETANGTAVVVCPGGGYAVLAADDPVLSRWPGLCARWMGGLGLLDR